MGIAGAVSDGRETMAARPMRARDQGPAGLAGAPAKAQAWPRWTLGYRASVAWTNWAGNYTYRARAIHAPSTLEQLQELVCGLPRVRVLGSRHSFTDIADCEELVSLAQASNRLNALESNVAPPGFRPTGSLIPMKNG